MGQPVRIPLAHGPPLQQPASITHWVVRNGYLRSPFVLVDIGVLGGISVRWQHLGDCLEVHGFDLLEEAIAPLRAQDTTTMRSV